MQLAEKPKSSWMGAWKRQFTGRSEGIVMRPVAVSPGWAELSKKTSCRRTDS
jgi:hypothetical protein